MRFAGAEESEEEVAVQSDMPPPPKKSFLWSAGGEDTWNVVELPQFEEKSIDGMISKPTTKYSSCWHCYRMFPAPQSVNMQTPTGLKVGVHFSFPLELLWDALSRYIHRSKLRALSYVQVRVPKVGQRLGNIQIWCMVLQCLVRSKGEREN